MNNISNVSNCVACGACINICPKKAIIMNTKGLFYYPEVNEDACTMCGLCLRHCPSNSNYKESNVISAFGCWYDDRKIVLNSSSGGAFYGMARHVIDDGGVVIGASFSSDFKAVEYHSTDEIPLECLQKSKYVESLIGNSFSSARAAIKMGRKVLFCGTPCHTAGLKNFLGQDYDNLIICDFACGGLPSHQIYQSYLEALERKYKSEITSVDFRPKTHGWERYAILVKFANGNSYNRLGVEDDYLRYFLYSKSMLRDSCLSCTYSERHVADITLADFWRCHELSALDNKNGISLVLCNTRKGVEFFKSISSQFVFEQLDTRSAAYNNKQLVVPTDELQHRNDFLTIYEKSGIARAFKHYIPVSTKSILKAHLARYLYRRTLK